MPLYECEDVDCTLPDHKHSGSEVIIPLFTSLMCTLCAVVHMCGCFGNMCNCIYCVFVLFHLCIFILFMLLFNYVSYVFLGYVHVFLLLCMFCSAYTVFIVPTGTLRLP